MSTAIVDDYGSTSLGGTRYQVFLAQGESRSYDLDGSALPIATCGYQYDAYNNATQITVQATDGFADDTGSGLLTQEVIEPAPPRWALGDTHSQIHLASWMGPACMGMGRATRRPK